MLYGPRPDSNPDASEPAGTTPPQEVAKPDAPESYGETSAGGPDEDPPSEPRPVDPHPDDPGGPDEDESPDAPEVPDPSDPDPDLEPDDPDTPDHPDLDPEDDPIEDDPLSPRAHDEAGGAEGDAPGGDPIFRRGGLSLGDTPDADRKKTKRRAPESAPPSPAERGVVERSAEAGAAADEDGEIPVRERIPATADDDTPESAISESSVLEGTVSESGSEPVGATDPVFRPDLESYSGPFELLLYLIHKDEVDIFDIPIASILKQFLGHVRRLEASGRLDLHDSGEYLVMAARLMEIKSRMLLPTDTEDEEDLLEAEVEDPRWSLVQQLLEFSAIKQRAQLLELAHRNRSQCYERIPGDLPPPEPGSLELKETSSLDLRAAFQRVLDLLRERDAVRVVPGEEIPIEVAMSGIREKLVVAVGRRRPFSELFPRELGLRGLISYFMALLELTRLRHLQLEQEDDYGDILVTLREAA